MTHDKPLRPLVLGAAFLLLLAMILVWIQFVTNEYRDRKCKTYGPDWHLWYNKKDASFMGCKSNEGVVKDIPT